MRRTRALMAASLTIAACAAGLAAVPSHADDSDTTKAMGPLGMTTIGLGKTGSYGEPSLAIAPDGKHVAASTPGCADVCIWYSSNDGKTWGHTQTSSPSGGGDSELEYLNNGTLLSADLEVKDSNIKISKDFGKTWDAGRSAGMEQDRQWFAHTPDGKRTFLVYHDFAAEAELISESKDQGKTWATSPQDQIVVQSGDQVSAPTIAGSGQGGGSSSFLDQGVNTFSGPMLINNNGKDFYVVYSISDAGSNVSPTDGIPPFGPVRNIVVAHSADAGKTWTNRLAVTAPANPDVSKEASNGTMFPWGFLDPAGTIYVVFGSTRGVEGTDHYHFYYVYSKDKGTTWSKAIKIDGMPLNKGGIMFNTGAGVRPGVIDVAWLESDTSTPSGSGTWYPWVAQITNADSGHPTIVKQKATNVPNHTGGICLQGTLCAVPAAPGSHDRSLADFIELAVNHTTGMAELVYGDNAGQRPDGTKGEVVFAKQTIDPSRARHAAGAPLSLPGVPPAVGGLAALALLGVAGARIAERRVRPALV